MLYNNANEINPATLIPGTVVSTGRPGYRHFGITTNRYVNGIPTVISNTGKFGRVIEEPLSSFQEESDLRIEGYWGKLPPHEVLRRAETKFGSPYMLFTSNCEHFVRFVHGLQPESPQLKLVFASLMLVGLVIGLSRA